MRRALPPSSPLFLQLHLVLLFAVVFAHVAVTAATSFSADSAGVIYQQQGLPSFYPATDNAIHWSGRVLRDDYGRATFDWPGVTASFRIEGNASVVEVLVNDTTVEGTRFAVYVDSPGLGQQHLQTFLTKRGIMYYPLLSNNFQVRGLAPPSNVTLLLVHTQESRYLAETAAGDNVTVVGFATDGLLASPRPATRRLEFIGDSITAGYGAEAAAPCHPSVLNNNYALTWAHLLCQQLCAECFVEAYSGSGVIFSYPDPTSPPITMPERYHDTLASNRQKGEGGHPWVVDIDAFRPDAIVINLGTNDFCCGGAKNASFVQEYEDAYVRFVMEVMQSYAVPSAGERKGKVEETNEGRERMRRSVEVKEVEVMADLSAVREEDAMLPLGAAALRGSPPSLAPSLSYPVVFLGVGPMSDQYKAPLQRVLKRLISQGVRAHYLDLMLAPNVAMGGCDSHPNEKVHQQVARQALPVLASVMGWEGDNRYF